MSLKVSRLAHKDITKILILLYIVTNKLLNNIIKVEDVNKYIYSFYIDNPEISKMNNNSIIRNIEKYNSDDLCQITRLALYEWKNDFNEGCLNFNENEIIVKVDNVSPKLYESSFMIAKMLYKKATNQDFTYNPNLIELDNVNEYNLDKLNSTRLKNRVLQNVNYCCCCDATDNLFIINISNDPKKINNPNNYITVCKAHYELFKRKYYRFNEYGQIQIFKQHKLLNKRMHISLKILKLLQKSN